MEKIMDILMVVLPAAVTAAIAYLFFKKHTDNEEGRRRFLIYKEAQATTLPLRFQAYERMALFLERIAPANLLLRINPIGDDVQNYQRLLIANIDQEFEHNLAQQIYVSEECWNVIRSTKNATIQLIRNAGAHEESSDAIKLREFILKSLLEKSSPSDTGLAYIKNEVKNILEQ